MFGGLSAHKLQHCLAFMVVFALFHRVSGSAILHFFCYRAIRAFHFCFDQVKFVLRLEESPSRRGLCPPDDALPIDVGSQVNSAEGVYLRVGRGAMVATGGDLQETFKSLVVFGHFWTFSQSLRLHLVQIFSEKRTARIDFYDTYVYFRFKALRTPARPRRPASR